MLRQLMGDDDFFDLLRNWAQGEHPGGVASTADFIAAAKAYASRADEATLDAFFQRWLYGTGRPVYAWSWSKALVEGAWQLTVEIQQVQSSVLFADSLDLQVAFGGVDPVTVRVAPVETLNSFRFDFPTEPTGVTLDPEHRLLHNAIAGPSLTAPLALLAPYPNPFDAAAGTSIQMALRRGGPLTVEVLDVLGRRVRSLWDGHREAGVLNVDWRGRDGDGTMQAGGVYFLRVRLGDYSETRKLVFLAVD